MNILPYDTMRRIDNIRREIDKVYRFPFTFFEENTDSHLNVPFTDVYETEKEVIISCDLPSLQRREDVTISVDNNVVTIMGTLNREQDVTHEDGMHRKERFSGQFRSSVSLPANVFSEHLRAIYKNGVLNVFLPKTNSAEKKSADIEFQH